MSDPQILIEQLLPSECNLVEQVSPDGKTLWLSGIFMQSSIANRNRRNYPMNEISNAVQSAVTRINESKGILGELDHPESLQINLDRVSHIITELKMEGTNAIGKAKILNTPMGNIARELIQSGVSIGVSSRGSGTVNESGMVSAFGFVTCDIVATPSAPNAYPAAVYESLQVAKNGKKILSLSEAMQQDKDAQKYFKQEIMKWLETGLYRKK